MMSDQRCKHAGSQPARKSPTCVWCSSRVSHHLCRDLEESEREKAEALKFILKVRIMVHVWKELKAPSEDVSHQGFHLLQWITPAWDLFMSQKVWFYNICLSLKSESAVKKPEPKTNQVCSCRKRGSTWWTERLLVSGRLPVAEWRHCWTVLSPHPLYWKTFQDWIRFVLSIQRSPGRHADEPFLGGESQPGKCPCVLVSPRSHTFHSMFRPMVTTVLSELVERTHTNMLDEHVRS